MLRRTSQHFVTPMQWEKCDNETPFVLVRLPHQNSAVKLTVGSLCEYASLDDVADDASGFIVAPFIASAEHPVYLLTQLHESVFYVDESYNEKRCAASEIVFADNREAYAESFAKVKATIDSGRCCKVVLSRMVTADDVDLDAVAVFASACRKYPRCYVALIHIPQQGMWLTATPELLYSQQGHEAHTMALAGTMSWQEVADGLQWTSKNQNEQQLVSDYITDRLSAHNISHHVGPPNTVQAGHLAHLCSEIDIRLSAHQSAMQLLRLLHPTPAVAGIPLSNALEVISDSERGHTRGYYAGFTGFLNDGQRGTQCYVSLRLLHYSRSGQLTLHAGGGIVADSDEESEWTETELKLLAMKSVVN